MREKKNSIDIFIMVIKKKKKTPGILMAME